MEVDALKQILKNNPALARRNPHILECLEKEKKSNKFNAKKIIIDGRTFHSMAEAEHYGELVILKLAHIIKDFECQPRYELTAGMHYTPDFKVTHDDGHIECVEVKGHWTEAARMRVKLFREKYPGIPLRIIHNGEVSNG